MEVASWVADEVEGVPKSRNSLNKSLIMTLPKRNLDLDPVVEDVVGAGLRNKVSCGHGGRSITLVNVLNPLKGGWVKTGWNWLY